MSAYPENLVKRSCAALVGFCMLISSCKDDKLVPDIESQYAGYFPLHQGQWTEYDADSIIHLETDDGFYLDTAIRAYHFQIREEVDSSFTDAEGEPAWRISRYKRIDSTYPWTFLNLWTAKLTSTSGQRVEDNIRFIKLSFPLDIRTTWNGNAYNNYPVEAYEYDDIHVPLALGSLSFDSTVTVIQNNFISNINRIIKREVYAKNVGLISKVIDSLNIVNLPDGSTVTLNGTEYKLEIRDFKK